MRLRSEATGGYDFSGLIAMAVGLLAISVGGLVMLILAAWRHSAGRSAGWLVIGGIFLLLPALVLALMAFG